MSFFTDLAGNDVTKPTSKPRDSSLIPPPPPPASNGNPILSRGPLPTGPREEMSNFRDDNVFPSIFPNFPAPKLPPLVSEHTRLIVVGGHDEMGKNMSVFQYENEYLLVDTGLQIPEDTKHGAKFCLPDISFLLPLKKNIAGILITNGHLDHIGGLRYILPALDFPPIYGTKFAIGFVEKQMEEAGLRDKAQLHIVDPESLSSFTVGKNFNITLFRENYTIPDACGICIETPHARIVHTGDFKFDFTHSVERPVDLATIAKIGDKGVDLLLSDSANSLQDGFTKTETSIADELEKIIQTHEGRVIIATFPSLIGRIQRIINIAEKYGKIIHPAGRAMSDGIDIGRELGYIVCKPETILKGNLKNIDMDPKRLIILTTGSEGEAYSGLWRMAHDDHPTVQIQPGDGIFLSPSSLQGNGPMIIETMNTLIRLGAIVYSVEGLDIHSTGHAAKDEQKLMLNLIHPKYFIPVHGELFMRMEHKRTAQKIGIPKEHVFLTDNGDIVDIDEKGRVICGEQKIKLEEIIVDGHGIGLAKSHVIDARRQMGKSGSVIIIFRVNATTREIDGPLKIETRGVAYLDEAREIHRLIIQKAKNAYTETVKDVPDIEEKDLLKIIKKDVETFLVYKIDREPLIIPVIISV